MLDLYIGDSPTAMATHLSTTNYLPRTPLQCITMSSDSDVQLPSDLLQHVGDQEISQFDREAQESTIEA